MVVRLVLLTLTFLAAFYLATAVDSALLRDWAALSAGVE